MNSNSLKQGILKQVLLIFSLLLLLNSCKSETKSQLEKTWIPIGKNDSNSFHTILTFEKDNIITSTFGIENDSIFPYSLGDNNEIYSDILPEARIIELNDQLLKISISEVDTIIFEPISQIKTTYTEEFILSLLRGREYEISNDLNLDRVYSFDSLARESSLLRSELINVFAFDKFDLVDEKIYHDFGFWTVKNILGQSFIYLENLYGDNDYQILLIDKINEKGIFCKNWNLGKDEILFSEVPTLTGLKLDSFKLNLTRPIWILSDFHIDKISGGSNSSFEYFGSIDSTLFISRDDFTSNNISYKFNLDNTFSRFIDSRLSYSGHWELIKGGEILRLKEKWHGEKNSLNHENFMLIKNLTEKELRIVTEEKLYVGFGAFDFLYIKQKYKNSP